MEKNKSVRKTRKRVTNSKVTEAQFWKAMKESYGFYARASRYIKMEYNVELTRTNVRERALRDEERLNGILEQNYEEAEETLVLLLRYKEDPRVQLSAARTLLTNSLMGLKRGFFSGNGDLIFNQNQTDIKVVNLKGVSSDEIRMVKKVLKKVHGF